jgi:crossover junction endodeoxyribonuclease RusA
MTIIRLPWPSPVLSPNAREHWAVVSRAKANYRNTARILTLQAKVKVSGPVTLKFGFAAPTARRFDLDNAIARQKSAIDGIADALKVDDSGFQFAACKLPKDPDGRGYVEVEIVCG